MIIDASFQRHFPVQSPPRIVSLVPSVTELLVDLSLTRYLVGRTGFCIHPKEILKSVTKVGGTKTVIFDKVIALNPTHIIVNIDENNKEDVLVLQQRLPKTQIVVTHPMKVVDNLALYSLLGAIFRVEKQAKVLSKRLQYLLAKAQNLRYEKPMRRVLYVIWQEPWMTVGKKTYIADMLSTVNWQVGQDDTSIRYPSFELECIENFDFVLLSTEPYAFTLADCQNLHAHTQKPVFLIDGEMVSWYGSRAILGLEYMMSFSNNLKFN